MVVMIQLLFLRVCALCLFEMISVAGMLRAQIELHHINIAINIFYGNRGC